MYDENSVHFRMHMPLIPLQVPQCCLARVPCLEGLHHYTSTEDSYCEAYQCAANALFLRLSLFDISHYVPTVSHLMTGMFIVWPIFAVTLLRQL